MDTSATISDAEETVLSEQEKKKIGAKELSKGAMVFATVWICVNSVLNWIGVLNADINDIVKTGFGMMLIWSPTYASMYIDKFLQRGNV